MYAEEGLGGLSLDVQDYPTALIHYEGAFRASQSIPGATPYMALHCVAVLWRLGRYADAERMLDTISLEAQKSTLIASGVALIRAQMKLSQLQNKEALAIAKEALKRFPEMSYGQIADFEEVIALAQVRLNRADEAAKDAETLMALGRKEADEGVVASGELAEAQALLALHRSGTAMAEAANAHFSATDEKESKWLSLFYAAQAARADGNADISSTDARKSIDILKQLEQDWGSPAFRQYATRPDNQLVLHELSVLNERKGDSQHAKP
jgi:hypothetical protein